MCVVMTRADSTGFPGEATATLPMWDYTPPPQARRAQGLRVGEGPRHHSTATLSVSPTRLPRHTP